MLHLTSCFTVVPWESCKTTDDIPTTWCCSWPLNDPELSLTSECHRCAAHYDIQEAFVRAITSQHLIGEQLRTNQIGRVEQPMTFLINNVTSAHSWIACANMENIFQGEYSDSEKKVNIPQRYIFSLATIAFAFCCFTSHSLLISAIQGSYRNGFFLCPNYRCKWKYTTQRKWGTVGLWRSPHSSDIQMRTYNSSHSPLLIDWHSI